MEREEDDLALEEETDTPGKRSALDRHSDLDATAWQVDQTGALADSASSSQRSKEARRSRRSGGRHRW